MDQINATTTENEWINQTAMERDTGACPPGSETYRVQRGDSFYLIARKFGVSVRALMNANPNIAAGHLLVGDILCVPVGEGRSCPVGSSAYTVRPGQSVVDVMLSSNVSLRALREYNEDIRLTALRPGDVLCVPPSGDRGLCENGGPVYRLQEGDTLDEIAEYEILAVIVTTAYRPDSFRYYEYTGGSQEQFEKYVSDCKRLSLYDTGVNAEYGDKLITLSTCEYSQNDGRLLVVAKKTEG